MKILIVSLKLGSERKINNEEFSSWIDERPDIVGGCCRIGKNEIKKMKSFIKNGGKKSI